MKISDQKLQEKIGFQPFDKQKEIIKCQERLITIVAGVRFGKSMIAAYRCLKALLADNKHIWIVAPSYDLTKKVFDYVVQWIAKGFPQLVPGIQNRPFPRISTPWNSWLEGRSAENPVGLLGEELDLIVVDEAARIPRKIWDSYLYARLISRQGRAILISTPFGKNWFYEKYLEAKETNSAFHCESKDNPFFPQEEWEKAREKLPLDVFQQEYQAIFLSDAATVFRNVREIVGETLQDAVPGHFYTMGVDLGKYKDFTVLIVIDRQTHNVVYFDRFKNIDWTFQKKRIIATAERYNHARITIDSTGVGDPIVDDLKAEGLLVDDFRYSNQSKKQLIEKLSINIDQKNITIPPIDVLIDELESFGYKFSQSGNVIYSAPEGLHDDCVNALALSVWNLTGNRILKNPIDLKLEEKMKRSGINKFQFE